MHVHGWVGIPQVMDVQWGFQPAKCPSLQVQFLFQHLRQKVNVGLSLYMYQENFDGIPQLAANSILKHLQVPVRRKGVTDWQCTTLAMIKMNLCNK